MKKNEVLKIGGISYPCPIVGKGEPCLLVGVSSLTIKCLSKHLRGHYQFFYPDLYWATEEPADYSKTTMGTLADDIEQCRLQLGLQNITLLAHSAPGMIALEYAIKYPQQLKKIILVGSRPCRYQIEKIEAYFERHATPERKERLFKDVKNFENKDLTGLSPTECWAAQYNASNAKYWYDFSRDHSSLWKGLTLNAALYEHYIKNLINEYKRTDAYSGIQAKVFVAMGVHDYAVPPIMWDNIKEKIPNLSFYEFTKSGHYPMLEEQELFDDLLLLDNK